jgi:hypothetical protein
MRSHFLGHTLRLLIKLASGVSIVIIGFLVIYQLILNTVDEYYSSGVVSASITASQERGVFVSQPLLQTNVLQFAGKKYPIREAWIERVTRAKYDLIFFRRSVPIGYRLILQIDQPPRSSPRTNLSIVLIENRLVLVCNNTIFIDSSSGSRRYTERISPPLPTTLNCMLKKENEFTGK